MASGNEIIVTGEPKGVFLEGYITGTPLPGTIVTLDVSEAVSNGRFTYEPFSPATGLRAMTAVLLPDSLKGKTETEAYVTGDRCFMYVPVAGEEMNVLVQDSEDAIVVGDLLIVETATGLLLETTGTPESEPFQALEALGTIAADTLCHVIATGQ
jgi:hypothetical protein|tara:strand:- start:347 stop:811 length:465 start_codon:yes stop_codon:yes gene_type:complete